MKLSESDKHDKINAIVQYINDITGGEEEYTVEDIEHEVCSDGVHIDFYVYRTNNTCIPRTSEKAEDMPTIDKNDVKETESNPKINKGNEKTD